MFKSIANFFRGMKERIRARYRELPSLEEIWRERKVFLQVVANIGDDLERWDPEDSWLLEQIVQNARIVEFVATATGLGSVKAEMVRERVQTAWKVLGRADDAFDTFWNAHGRKLLNDYVRNCNEANAWIPPV